MDKKVTLTSMTILIFVLACIFFLSIHTYASSNITTRFEQKSDLNGDGKLDKVVLNFTSVEYPDNVYTLTVNGVKLNCDGVSVVKKLNIVDINKSDKLKEIAIEEDGPSDDYLTTFYWYDGKKLIRIGSVQGKSVTGKLISGNGVVGAVTRFEILQTWFFKDEYKLSSKHSLIHIAKKWYKTTYAQQVKVLKPLKLYTDIGSKKLLTTLKIGDKVQMVGSDNKAWCVVKTKKGQLGWFEMDGYSNVKQFGINALSVFEGLCMAD